MIIAIEGPDNSGKSTLAEELSRYFYCQLIHPGGPPKSKHERLVKMSEQLHMCHLCFQNRAPIVVYDRITCISDPIYRFDLYNTMCRTFRDSMIFFGAFVIYCRPSTDILMAVQNHLVKPHDTEEQVERVKKHQKAFIDLYDAIMSNTQYTLYDYMVNDVSELINSIKERMIWRI